MGGDAGKQEANLADFIKLGMVVPKSFHIQYYKEKSIDLIRFKQYEDAASFLNLNSGYLKEVGGLPELDLQVVATATVGHALDALVSTYHANDDSESLCRQCAKFTSDLCSENNGFDATMNSELVLLSELAGSNDASMEKRLCAWETLDAKRQNASYTGVMENLFQGDAWPRFKAVLDDSSGRLQDTL